MTYFNIIRTTLNTTIYYTNCALLYKSCRKVKTVIDEITTSIIRSCGVATKKNETKFVDALGYNITINECLALGCNGSTLNQSLFGLICFIVLFVYAYN
jgi:hypothetical protein